MKSFHDVFSAGPRQPHDLTNWRHRHNAAVLSGREPLVLMLKGWFEYAEQYKNLQFTEGAPIGEDYVLGLAWEEIGDKLRTLLNGEIGSLDGGTCDSFILDTMRANGIDTEQK